MGSFVVAATTAPSGVGTYIAGSVGTLFAVMAIRFIAETQKNKTVPFVQVTGAKLCITEVLEL